MEIITYQSNPEIGRIWARSHGRQLTFLRPRGNALKETNGTFDALRTHADVEVTTVLVDALTSARLVETALELESPETKVRVYLNPAWSEQLWAWLVAARPDLTANDAPISAAEAVSSPGCATLVTVPLALGLGWVMEWMGTWEVFFTGGRGLGGWIIALVLDALIALGAFVGSWVGDGLAALLVLVGVFWAAGRLIKRPVARTLGPAWRAS